VTGFRQNHLSLPEGGVHTFFRQNRTAAVAYTAASVNFDGTNDYLTRGADLTGLSDGKAGTVSMWLDFTGGDSATQIILGTVGATLRFTVFRSAGNQLTVRGRNTSGTNVLQIRSAGTIVAATGWVNLLASFDLAATVGHLYINDANDLEGGATLTNDNIDFTEGNFSVGGTEAGGSKCSMDCADFWFNNTYLDLSVEANRRKFIDSSGDPVDLATDGSGPTGSSPLIWLSKRSGEAAADFASNNGGGGGFTVNGTLTDGSSSPSP
jgi:hypothetical protein